MTRKHPRALVIDRNLGVLAHLVRPLALKGFRIAARPTPEDALDYVRRSRPELVLLGQPYWRDGWITQIQAASPGTVVVPVPTAPTTGVA
jgi:hypothetical protein